VRAVLARHRAVWRAWAVFVFWIALFSALAVLGAASWLEPRLIALVAKLTAAALTAVGKPAQAGGAYVYGPGLTFEIIPACTALQPMLLVLAAVFAYPCRWRDKLLGAAVGVGGLFLVNLLRLVSLYFIGLWWPSRFEQMHILLWQPLVMLAAVALWLFWVLELARPQVTQAAR